MLHLPARGRRSSLALYLVVAIARVLPVRLCVRLLAQCIRWEGGRTLTGAGECHVGAGRGRLVDGVHDVQDMVGEIAIGAVWSALTYGQGKIGNTSPREFSA